MEQRLAELEEKVKELGNLVQGLTNNMTSVTTALSEFIKFAQRHEDNTVEIVKRIDGINDNLAKLNTINNRS